MDYIFSLANPKIEPIYFVIAVIIALLAGVVTEYYRRQGRMAKAQSIAMVLLTAYIFLVFASTVFSRVPREYYRYELIPFWSYREILKGSWDLFWENILNVGLLLPIGMLLPMASGNRSKNIFQRTLLAGVFISLVIESLQLFLKCGLFEFDDMFHNTIGVAIGYWGYCRMKKVKKAKKKKGAC